MKKRRLITYISIGALLVSNLSFGFADSMDAPYSNVTFTKEKKNEGVMNLTAQQAVEYGLEHNMSIKILDNKINLALVAEKNAEINAKKLKDSQDTLNAGWKLIQEKKKLLVAGQKEVDAKSRPAQKALDMGLAPQDIDVKIPASLTGGAEIPLGKIIAAENIHDWTVNKCKGPLAPYQIKVEKTIKDTIQATIDAGQQLIEENKIKLTEATIALKIGEYELKDTLKSTSEKLDAKINYNTIVKLDIENANELMISMAGVNLDVTKYAKGIYKNQIAMLIQKNYYDVLHAEKILTLKKKAEQRGREQYNIVKLSYDNGMKAKDDFILSKMYFSSTGIALEMAEAEYENAVFELKKNMNLTLDTEIILVDSLLKEAMVDDLMAGLKSGSKNRIEIQQNLGQLMIYKLNEEILGTMILYRDDANVNKEARLLREASEIELEQVQKLVATEIHQSYGMMIAVGDMLKLSNELISDAEEVVQIADLKYQQGFGAENSLLKQMNLESSSGTIIELIAAEENLVKVQAQVAQIRYSYTMAKVKYLNDAGILTY